jgi:serine/threonine protein kinase/tetratricopeptide (TPR) repeat protein
MLGKTISHYKIIEKLGGGGMGVVYKAKDTNLDRIVALKFLPQHLLADKEAEQRFISEAKAASSFDHPNICTIYDINKTEDDQFYIVMGYYAGETLKKKLNAGPLQIDTAINYATQIANGLTRAHEAGIIHRDIKPANIMITDRDEVKILDFGLAKTSSEPSITKMGSTVGTVSYMSPEQTKGEKVDHRTDIWSLGVLLYQMLSGSLPFQGDYEQAIIYSILNEDPAQIMNIPVELEQLVMKMLEKEPRQRFPKVEELLKSLEEIYASISVKLDKPTEKAIAVLPFENLSAEKDTDYFTDGLAEELIVNLSGLQNIRVVPRTTSAQYKDSAKNVKKIGRELGVNHIITGSVRKHKDSLRISVQLIVVGDNSQIWAETFKGKLADVFDIQEKVSKQIVDALMIKLSPQEKVGLEKRTTSNPEAFDYYLRARDIMYDRTRNGLNSALKLFQEAIELDSRYAAAFAGIGEVYSTIYRDFERKDIWLDKALEASLKALMYDSTLSEAYAALGLAYFGKNERDEALTASQKAIELDANNYNAYWILARIYHTTDRDNEAAEALEKAIALNPDFIAAYSDLTMYYETMGDLEKLDVVVHKAIKIYPKYLLRNPNDSYRRMAYAIDLLHVQKIKEAKIEGRKALELNPSDPVMIYFAACFHARLGEKTEALERLKEAITAGFQNFDWIKRDPDLANIRQEPMFIRLVEAN